VAGDFASKVRPLLEVQLEAGEALQGVVAATHQKTFSGGLYALAVTDRRLILLPLDRRLQPKGPLQSIAPDELVSADADGAGGGWWSTGSAILDATALKVELRTRGGDKMKLMFMKGGEGMLGGLGGGESQQQGVRALAEWLQQRFGGA
jgi:hypothetical protein